MSDERDKIWLATFVKKNFIFSKIWGMLKQWENFVINAHKKDLCDFITSNYDTYKN